MRRLRPAAPILLAVIAATAAAVLVSACGSSGGSASDADGTEPTTNDAGVVGTWALSTYRADATMVPAAADPAQLTLATDGTFAGSTGCNRMTGTWSGSPGAAVTITPGPMTKRACVDPSVQAQETALTTMLPEVSGAEITASGLTLTDAGGDTLFTFVAASADLAGTYTVTGVNNGTGGVESSAAAEAASITFDEAGTVSGTTGCNTFTGGYTVDGDQVSIGDVASTLIGCEPEAQAFEQQFLAALEAVSTWEQRGSEVTLRDADGATQLTLVAG